jgi:hypothetical protein
MAATFNPVSLGLNAGFGIKTPKVPKNNCRTEKVAIVNTFHQVISYSIFKGVQNCSNQVSSRQLISIGCYPNNTTSVYEANPVCRQCYEDNFAGILQQHQMQRNLLYKDPTIKLSITDEYEALVTRLNLCGLRHCKACVLSNTTQSTILGSSEHAITVDCISEITNSNQFVEDFSATLKQFLTENTDILNVVAEAVGGKNPVNKIVQDVVSRTTQVVNQTFLSQLLSNIQNNQMITLRMSDGIINGITQESVYNSITKQVTESSIATQILSDTLINAISDVLDKQITLDSLGNMVFQPIAVVIDTIGVATRYIVYAGIALLIAIGILILSYLVGEVRGQYLHVDAFLPSPSSDP